MPATLPPPAARPRLNPLTVPRLATLLQVGGATLGLPSLAVLVVYAGYLLQQALAAPPPVSSSADQADGLLGLLHGVTQFVGGVAGVLGAIADIVLALAALAAGIGLVVATACWCIGRGLARHARWARFGAAALLIGAMLLSALLALSFGGAARAMMGVPVVVCGLGLQALWAAAGAGLQPGRIRRASR